MINQVTVAVGAINTTLTAIRGAFSMKREFDIAGATADILKRLIEIENACLVLIEEKAALTEEKRNVEQRILDLEAKYADLSHYKPHTLASGAHVYIDDRLSLNLKAPIYFCATCIEGGQKTTLQLSSYGFRLNCPRGHAAIDTGKKAKNTKQRSGGGPGSWMGV